MVMIGARRIGATVTGEETFEGLERWLKQRRDEHKDKNNTAWNSVDWLLDEARDAAAVGCLPWSEAWEDIRQHGD